MRRAADERGDDEECFRRSIGITLDRTLIFFSRKEVEVPLNGSFAGGGGSLVPFSL
jgi:hypothetical protein